MGSNALRLRKPELSSGLTVPHIAVIHLPSLLGGLESGLVTGGFPFACTRTGG